MSVFLSICDLEPVDDVFWRVRQPFRYESDALNGQIIEVRPGFVTDLESMTRWLPVLYSILGDKAIKPAVIHDWLYYTAITDRKTADTILYEAMCIDGYVPGWQRHLIYEGVRLFAWKAWNDHRKAGHSLQQFIAQQLNLSTRPR
jgi:hypothetical protein